MVDPGFEGGTASAHAAGTTGASSLTALRDSGRESGTSARTRPPQAARPPTSSALTAVEDAGQGSRSPQVAPDRC